MVKTNNYARHRSTGQIVLLWDGMIIRTDGTTQKWIPKRPEDWAIWRPIERLRSMRRIGEDPSVYLLRQLEVSLVAREASMLRRRWKREGLTNDDRERVAVLAREHLRETFLVN